MLLDLDTIIFVSFLIINLIVGLYYSRGVRTVREYAIGNGKFSLKALVSTIVATSIGAGTFSYNLSESYRQGLYYIIPAILSDFIAMLIIGYVLAPRMTNFFGCLTVAEAIGKIYGRNVRVTSAIAGLMLSIGIVASQFKVSAMIMQLFFDIPDLYAITISATIIILYSAFGGIRSVTFTDILQFSTFTVVIPLICIVIWRTTLNSPEQVFETVSTHPLFDLNDIMSINNPKFFQFLFLLLVFIIPGIDPATFQRISMSQGISLARRSFVISGCIFAIIVALVCWTGVILLSGNPNLDADNLLPYVLNNYTYTGLKGLTAIGIMATIMSTADSYINSATVLLTHDIIRNYNTQHIKPQNEVLLLRIVGLSIGILAIVFASNMGNLFHLILKTLSFYMPIVSVPLLLSFFGFYSDSRVVISGMFSGAIVVILWSIYGNPDISETPIAMLANLVTFIIMHILLGKPKGGFTDNINVNKKPQKFVTISHNIVSQIKNFDLIRFFKWSISLSKTSYFFVGLLSIVTVLVTVQIMPLERANTYAMILNKLYISSLICASIFMTKPIWYKSYLDKIYTIFQTLAVPYTLILVPLIFFSINFVSSISMIILLSTLIAFMLLSRWQITLFIITLMICVLEYFPKRLDFQSFENFNINIKFKIFYLITSLSILLIAFLKPRQEEQELTEEIAEHLSHELEYRDKQIANLANLKQVFLRNLQHETNTPVTGIYSMSQALGDCYDKLNDIERKKAINTITTSSERLISYVSNLVDVSKIVSASYNLKISKVNLSNLLEEVIRKCSKLYIPKDKEDDREIITDIENSLYAECDEYYIRKSFENLIINAIQYCKKGVINITLAKELKAIKLTVQDSGIGIPESEYDKIFEPFEVSSKTLTQAGGRGMGLTLVKAAIEAHKGNVSVTSESSSGSSSRGGGGSGSGRGGGDGRGGDSRGGDSRGGSGGGYSRGSSGGTRGSTFILEIPEFHYSKSEKSVNNKENNKKGKVNSIIVNNVTV